MSKKNETNPDQFEAVENALSKTEHYIEENQKSLTVIIFAIIIIVGGYLGYKKFVMAPKETDAQSQMWMAEQWFAKDSFNLALNGDGNDFGFLDIIENYNITKSANLAYYYAGVSYLRLGQYEDAVEHLIQFETDDEILAPIAYGAIGDAYTELENTDDALTFYKKAVTASNNQFTTPIYLMKIGVLQEQIGEYKKALDSYKKIEKDFANTTEGRQIDKYIARIEMLIEK